jgi:para-aminobenzoate synthetase component 1
MVKSLKEKLNALGKKRTPFLFIISYDLSRYFIQPLSTLPKDVKYSINCDKKPKLNREIPYSFKPISKERYERAFHRVIEQIKSGNTYLLNLTFPSKIEIDYTLDEIYEFSDARFKLLFRDRFVCFSPERFIKIKDNKISTYPMKGTIDNKIENAKEKILSNQKEMAEHTMVVDLLRNDLSMVAKQVRVKKFRYTEIIKAGSRELLQVSSEIEGVLQDCWQDRVGDILTTLLPAGSITGTPKKMTTKIIKEVEGYDRGFYSGVFGVFDGDGLDSAVMIRFIEREGSKLIYKSGGGITIDSDLSSEYNEMCEKIYVPFL